MSVYSLKWLWDKGLKILIENEECADQGLKLSCTDDEVLRDMPLIRSKL